VPFPRPLAWQLCSGGPLHGLLTSWRMGLQSGAPSLLPVLAVVLNLKRKGRHPPARTIQTLSNMATYLLRVVYASPLLEVPLRL